MPLLLKMSVLSVNTQAWLCHVCISTPKVSHVCMLLLTEVLLCLPTCMCGAVLCAQITKLEVEAGPGLSCSKAENILTLV